LNPRRRKMKTRTSRTKTRTMTWITRNLKSRVRATQKHSSH